MSTRCNIEICDYPEGEELNSVLLYKHHDGYPDTEHGVKQLLKEVLEEYNPQNLDEFVDKLVGLCRCEITDGIHSDIEYYYRIYLSGKNISLDIYTPRIRREWIDQPVSDLFCYNPVFKNLLLQESIVLRGD